ncbi:hypothetical protein D3C72_2013940 [compost metagenome]
MIRRYEGEGRRNHLIAIIPAEFGLEHVKRQMQADSVRAQEMRMSEASISRPLLFHFDSLKTETRPAFFQALANAFQTFVDTKIRHEELNRHEITF